MFSNLFKREQNQKNAVCFKSSTCQWYIQNHGMVSQYEYLVVIKRKLGVNKGFDMVTAAGKGRNSLNGKTNYLRSFISSFFTEELMTKPEVRGVRFLFLVGGFAESPMLQKAVQKALGRTCRIIIPHDVGLTILKGAVLFGLDPTVVRVREYRKVSE